MTRGFTIGKFAPFHKGHEHLIQKGVNEMNEFYVIVYDDDFSGINIETKIKWIKNRFPEVKIIKAFNSPKQFGLDKDSVNIQMNYLKKLINDIKFTHFYSSEDYGKYVAQNLGLINVIVDKDREKYNISATKIRNDVNKHKKFLDEDIFIEYNNVIKKQ